MSIKQNVAVAGIALISISGAVGVAYAAKSSTPGGYAYNFGYNKVYACDTSDDGHQIEAQARLSTG